jgi:hypothetical protein
MSLSPNSTTSPTQCPQSKKVFPNTIYGFFYYFLIYYNQLLLTIFFVPQENPQKERMYVEGKEQQTVNSFGTKERAPETTTQRAEREKQEALLVGVKKDAQTDVTKQDLITAIITKTKKKTGQKQHIRDEVTTQIEKVMEDGLGETYDSLSVIQKQQFKIKGEETVFEIRNLMQKTKLKMKTILRLLLDWMKIIPGVNHFFLEQEAKIKADQIFRIHQRSQSK